jgi:hypothetical protein
MQCAWCGRLITADGHAVGERLLLLDGVSHGICADCAAVEMAKVRARRTRARAVSAGAFG